RLHRRRRRRPLQARPLPVLSLIALLWVRALGRPDPQQRARSLLCSLQCPRRQALERLPSTGTARDRCIAPTRPEARCAIRFLLRSNLPSDAIAGVKVGAGLRCGLRLSRAWVAPGAVGVSLRLAQGLAARSGFLAGSKPASGRDRGGSAGWSLLGEGPRAYRKQSFGGYFCNALAAGAGRFIPRRAVAVRLGFRSARGGFGCDLGGRGRGGGVG